MFKTIKTDRLLPCPFCGEDAEIGWCKEDGKHERFYVGCSRDNCCELDQAFFDLDKCIDAWNTRKLIKEDEKWIIT